MANKSFVSEMQENTELNESSDTINESFEEQFKTMEAEKTAENEAEQEQAEPINVTGDILTPELFVDGLEFINSKALPPVSNRYGTGKLTEAKTKFNKPAKKMMMPIAKKCLATLKVPVNNPWVALLEAMLLFYTAVLVPDIIEGGAGKDYKKKKKVDDKKEPTGKKGRSKKAEAIEFSEEIDLTKHR